MKESKTTFIFSRFDVSQSGINVFLQHHKSRISVMLRRKIQKTIQEYYRSSSNKILLLDGARQIGKSFIIRYEAIIRFNFIFYLHTYIIYRNNLSFSN